MNFDPAMAKIEHIKQEKDGLGVWDDIFRFAKSGFASIQESDFARMRWFGIYQQKPNEGHFMWRIKLPGGRLTVPQARITGEIANLYGKGIVDITTRQDIQLHWLTIECFPDALDRIYNQAGLYTDFACGDTPRNTCSCPLDGVLKNQICDLGGLVQGISDMYRAGGREFSNLPRKFKTAISACPLHCCQPQINDVGFFGVIRRKHGREERGLGVLVGGGLSSTPHYAQGLRVFIPEDKVQQQAPDVARRVCNIFRDADELRYKRKRARMKFLVADKGWQWFRDNLEQRLGYALIHDDEITNPRGGLHTDHMGIGEQNDGLYYVGVAVERGRTSGDKLIEVANLTERFAAPGRGELRLSQKQNILIPHVPKENVDALVKELGDLGLPPNAPLWRESLVSCTGTQFCNLAVTETKDRARSILKYLEEEVELDSPIMVGVTGCPNSCSQYQIADIGLTGTKAVWEGEKTDAFDMLVGGSLGEKPEFAQVVVQKIPAPIVQKVIGQLVLNYKANRVEDTDGEVETFRDFVARQKVDQLRKWSEIPEWTAPAPKAPRAVKSVPAGAA